MQSGCNCSQGGQRARSAGGKETRHQATFNRKIWPTSTWPGFAKVLVGYVELWDLYQLTCSVAFDMAQLGDPTVLHQNLMQVIMLSVKSASWRLEIYILFDKMQFCGSNKFTFSSHCVQECCLSKNFRAASLQSSAGYANPHGTALVQSIGGGTAQLCRSSLHRSLS